MNYLARLHALKAEKCPTVELTKPTKPPNDGRAGGFGSFGSYSDRPVFRKGVPLADPAAWLVALVELDTCRPPAGIAPDLWPAILADARWIARVHGDNAAALGWSASDLFGIGKEPGNGGLADRLEGARRLAFTSSVAHWRGEECEGWLWRRTLDAKPLLWEV
ncbi:MAG: hypothetical protein KGL48_06650 [Sphingomonadales bacterium]|nr:hypothetical protein [Sphingomonadales bacterium]MDE2568601.1 hypothetical protein [Sphingomonadales bacterium]